jgi:hypothetical protein
MTHSIEKSWPRLVMTTYRAIDIDPGNDVHGDETLEETLAPRCTTSRMSVRLEEYKQLRKTAPTAGPLPRTMKWVASLPPNVQPTVLLRHYARIANVIAATWAHETSLRSYMNCLFNDNRGTRQGFPPEVLSELVALKRYHDTLKAGTSAD